ncbi:Deoxycytidine kinase 1 [Yamadazyma tenuis]|uniref:Dedicator of cytokinesis protein 4 CRK binding protein n=1 Tax=Candida tenuis (strain ATCC 10573 / BCRC 21748 / CBS 615 / JCM 9827 / NBRC 10315 / NRRL Y-1498 / VKM Y-70) TaxID=590646 RepID=G3AXZ1_CANTC|nr:dedicator of cytokinesis protein 4 CRK binding protein [Yamadazyma tenuis ATCC 10573]EGV65727.1 dedicator of cytokinesis protein 4 CRK binding protein [Yamadazyma tenuis ATCC 10573]WEJ95957.1 Deoxycytidine kinase 1 [Yamadazyma tenuis]
MSWEPTDTFLRGKVIKPFLPFEKHPDLINDNLQNLFPGDEVYIFETKNAKWARGYTVTRPFPHDFTITSVNLDELPTTKVKVSIFPLSFIEVLEKIPIRKAAVDKEFNNIADMDMVPTIEDSERERTYALAGAVPEANGNARKAIPQLPLQRFDVEDSLLDELKYTLNLLTAHIFALYSIGEFRLFNKLSQNYTELEEARVKLTHNLLTVDEVQSTKENVTFILDKIPKKLASKAARLNDVSYDLDNAGTDISGYKAILARQGDTGELLNFDNSLPSGIAANQVFCALQPNFPINYHYNDQEFSLAPRKNSKLIRDPPSHVLVDFKSVSGSSAYQPPGFAGTIAYLYIRNNRKRLTEAFAVHTDSVNDLIHVEKISAALFRNIPATETENTRVYLVAVLTEEIDLNLKESSNTPQVRRVKKGVAAGVADITRVFSRNKGSLTSGESHQFVIKLFGSYVNQKRNLKDTDGIANGGWGEIVDRIIAGSNHGVAVNPRAEKLTVAVKEFKHQFTTHENGDLENKNIIGSATPIARIKPIFFDPLAENYERLYLKMGKISLLNSITKDDLLTFEVSTPNNELITFAKASNQQEKRSWQFVSVFPDEVVGEIIKVNGISLKNPSKKLIKDDYIVLALFINGSLAGEGKLLYKTGNRLVEFNQKKNHIIEVTSTPHNIPMAQVEVTTEYIGKVYNSDSSIDSVFQHERYFKTGAKGMDELAASLIAFTKLGVSQLVKYFPELLGSLYNIIETASAQPSSSSVEILLENSFKAIIHLLDTIFGKQEQYCYMVDLYVHNQPSRPKVGVFLLNRLSELFSRAGSSWNAVSRSLCRVISVVIRLAITSMKDTEQTPEYFEAIKSLFRSVSFFLTIQSPSLINDQVLILEVIDYILSFNTRLNEEQTLEFVINFIDSIGIRGLGANEDVIINKKPVVAPKDHKIIVSKLLLIHRLFGTKLAKSPNTLPTLICRSVVWAMEVLLGPTDIDASRLACTVLNEVCTSIWNFYIIGKNEDEANLSYSLSKLLPTVARTFIKYNKFTRNNDYFKPRRTFTALFPSTFPFNESSIDSVVSDEVIVEILVELATVFSFIAKIAKSVSGNQGYAEILSTEIENDFFNPKLYLANDFQNEDLITLMTGARLIRQGKYFPEDKWLTLYATLAEGCLSALELVRPLLIAHHIPPIDKSEMFDRVLWGVYLKNLLKLGTIAPVSVEHLSDVPRKACMSITGDMRDRIAYLINEAWDALAWDAVEEDTIRFNLNKFGGYQVEFISSDYSILQYLMPFALQKNVQCQSVSVKVLWSIMVSEYILSDSIIDVERECLLGLHDVYNGHSYKPSIVVQESFIDRMKSTIRLDREDEAFNLIFNFIQTLQGFLLVLNDLTSVPVGAEFDDDRTFHKLNINAYLKNANKPELFHSFINQMYEENLKKNDYIQAALSLELLASTYVWNHQITVPPSFRPKFPEQTSFERKEALYKMIAQNYIKGNSLERATDTYNELLDSYNQHTYDLKSFSYVHNKLAKLYLDLESSDKLTPSFFRVAFIGAGFPSNIRGKDQIYEGLPFEHISSIHERLLRLYPGARIISDDAEAQRLKERLQTGRYLYVNTIEPISEISDKLFNTSIGVRQYARNKDLRFFTTMKRIPGSTSVFDLWTEETTFETYLSFPTLMNRSEIKTSRVVKLSPLDNAIKAIVRKNNDLVQLESLINIAFKEKADYMSLFNDLSRQLAGTVDSPVNGGVGQYRTFFNDAKYYGKDEYADNIRLLKNAFDDLTLILSRCLHLHGKLVSPSMKTNHDALVSLYIKNFKEEIQALDISTDYDNTNYNHNVAHYQPSVTGAINDKRSISASSGISNGASANGSRLTKSTSRTSSASSNSGLSGLSSDKNSTSNSFASSAYLNAPKRTALNWRNMVNRT